MWVCLKEEARANKQGAKRVVCVECECGERVCVQGREQVKEALPLLESRSNSEGGAFIRSSPVWI